MGADFYEDDYEGGGYYDGGGYDLAADLGGDFFYGYGADTGAEYGDSGYSPGGNGPIDYASYEQQWGLEAPPIDSIPDSAFGGNDLFGAYYDYYLDMGLDPVQAAGFAAEDAAGGSIQTFTDEAAPLPDLSFPFYGLPYVPNYDYWQSPSYVPTFYELPVPPPPAQSLPTSPTTQQPNLPPACPGGQYHPYPIGHPQQNVCVPFPPLPAPQPQRPSGQQSGGGSSAPKPPAQQQQPKPPQQQQCPTGYYRASNGQCLPIPRCTTPGTVFDAARGICVPRSQAVSPLPSSGEDILSSLKNLPWWFWAGLGALFLLNRDDERTTTVRYRRAS